MLIDVVVVNEQRANVQEVDVEERKSFRARSQGINKRFMLMPVATTRKSRSVHFNFLPPLMT